MSDPFWKVSDPRWFPPDILSDPFFDGSTYISDLSQSSPTQFFIHLTFLSFLLSSSLLYQVAIHRKHFTGYIFIFHKSRWVVGKRRMTGYDLHSFVSLSFLSSFRSRKGHNMHYCGSMKQKFVWKSLRYQHFMQRKILILSQIFFRPKLLKSLLFQILQKYNLQFYVIFFLQLTWIILFVYENSKNFGRKNFGQIFRIWAEWI